ncbi:hypothetical protein CCYA_CCYA20G4795 [Cyanidiococcus yangmingshanensis]|nr:hypothetical protein CCYA_CCYA20G4795 [Cyanidiococcus yangmingshanensis]
MVYVQVSPCRFTSPNRNSFRCYARPRTTELSVGSFVSLPKVLRPQTQKLRTKRKGGLSGLTCMLTGPDGGFLGVGTPELLIILLFAWILLGPKGTYEAARNIGSFIANLRETASQARDQFVSALGEDYDSARREVEGIRDTLVGALEGNVEDDEDTSNVAELAGETQVAEIQGEKEKTDLSVWGKNSGLRRSEEEARAYFLDALERVHDPNQVPPSLAVAGTSLPDKHATNGRLAPHETSVDEDEADILKLDSNRLYQLEERVAALEAAITALKNVIETQHKQRVS